MAILPALVKRKTKKKKGNPSLAYLDLYTRQWNGVVEVKDELAQAYAAGHLKGQRRLTTWREQIALLEEIGLIKTVPAKGLPYGVIKLNHPTLVVAELAREGVLPADWVNTYKGQQATAGERTLEEILGTEEPAAADTTKKVVDITRAKAGS